MDKFAASGALLSLFALIASACGAPAAEPSSGGRAADQPSAVAQGGDLVYLRAGDPSGELVVLEFDGGKVVGRSGFGLAARDWSVVYRAESSGGKTVLKALDPLTNATLRERVIDGSYLYELPTTGFAGEPAGLSPNGKWLALRARGTGGAKSAFLVLNTDFRGPSTPVELGPDFDFDALDDSGNTLFLEERGYAGQPSGAGYRVRAYDLKAGSLWEGVVADKGTPGNMSGTRVGAIPSPSGRWMFTLYMRPDRPFVHAVDMKGRFSVCLFLPAGRSDNGEGDLAWTFVPSPDGKRAYAVNVMRGVVAAIDLETVKLAGAVTLSFAQADEPNGLERVGRWFVPVAEAKAEGFTAAVVSPDGKTLYALGAFGDGIFAVDLDSLTVVKRHLTALHQLVGLGISPDGASLYSTDGGGVLLRIDAWTGDVVARAPTAVRASKILRVAAR